MSISISCTGVGGMRCTYANNVICYLPAQPYLAVLRCHVRAPETPGGLTHSSWGRRGQWAAEGSGLVAFSMTAPGQGPGVQLRRESSRGPAQSVPAPSHLPCLLPTFAAPTSTADPRPDAQRPTAHAPTPLLPFPLTSVPLEFSIVFLPLSRCAFPAAKCFSDCRRDTCPLCVTLVLPARADEAP